MTWLDIFTIVMFVANVCSWVWFTEYMKEKKKKKKKTSG